MRLRTLTSACSIVIAGLPIEEKQKLMRELAHEFGYALRLEARVPEDSSTTRYLEERQMTIEFAGDATGTGNTSPGT